MPADESALVLVLPDDTVASVVAKVRQSGAANVQLLVADSTAALQTPGSFAQLRRSLGAGVGVMVISSDDRTLDAARSTSFDVVGVQGTQVRIPSGTGSAGQPRSYETQALPAIDEQADLSPEDVALLDAIDRAPVHDRYANLPEVDDDLLSDLQDFSDALDERPPSPGRRLVDVTPHDDWDDNDEPIERIGRRPARHTAPIPRSTDTLAASRGAGLGRRERSTRTERVPAYEEAQERPRRSALWGLLPVLLLLLLLGVAGYWLLTSRATINVTPPPPAVGTRPFNGVVLAITADVPPQNAAVVQTLPVSAMAETTVQGQAGQTLAAVGVARGTVALINALPQPIDLPQGTEFIGTNAAGQEVRFLIDAPAAIPPAVTTTTFTGSSTAFGQIEVAVSARSPGSPSNIGPNSITQLQIPGQAPIPSGTTLRISQANPIAGGDEQQVYVVTEEDVRRVLGDALTRLLNEASVQQLGSQTDLSKFEIDRSTIMPDATALGDPSNYEPPIVNPPIGQQLDPNNTSFSVTVRARFSGLATPIGRPVQEQLKTVVPQYFSQSDTSLCQPGERLVGAQVGSSDPNAPQGWRWDGSRLLVSGTVTCQLAAQEIRSRVLTAVRGQSRTVAEDNLRQLQEQHIIGSYTLPPDKSQFSRFDALLDIQLQTAGPVLPTEPTAQPQPSTGAQP